MGNPPDRRCDLDDLLEDVSGLVSPPEIIIRLRSALDAPGSTASSLAAIVAQDPNLSAQILRLANSAMYGLPQRVETVSRAIAVIGTRALYHLALAVTATHTFSRLPCELVNMAVFWRHSVFTALIAHDLAQRCNVLHPERLFVAGLLHDVGSLVLYGRHPDLLRETMLITRGCEPLLASHEREILGFDHADVGAELLTRWGLPESLRTAIRLHHQPDRALGTGLEATLVYLADMLSNRTEQGCFSEFGPRNEEIPDAIWERLGLDPEDGEDCRANVGWRFMETLTVILPQARY
ncbi:HDOD domain-containing protein [Ectothiorhodospira shaposhnikovii]|uniref:HDOD domain-containing protein n=1 Tax=Ectothiorhodospira shaposhnikovii TaxID=1054 RepID=UPI001EE78825|nr:HDOD domain-containing protein [Ectothiorhodospira shaposhnikovii]MCG5511558.1 HDOD domain-containing protein [Ectothiorhodospira shaposhnikovii]